MTIQNRVSVYFLALTCLIFPRQTTAQATPAPVVTLAEVLDLARQRNPDIQAARSNWQMAEAKILPTKTWEPPAVSLQYMGFPRDSANVGTAPEKRYGLSQDIPFPGKLHYKGKAAEHAARLEREIYRSTEFDVMARVKTAYYKLMLSQRAIRILNENLEVMRRFAKIAESKYSVGKASQSDALRAQVELAKMLSMLLVAEQDKETKQAELNALLDKSPEEPLGLAQEPAVEPLPYAYEELERIALAERPEVHAAGHHVDHMQATLAASRADYLPDFMVQYTLRTRQGMANDSMGMVKMSLPFLYFWRRNSEVKSVRFELDQARAMLRSAQVATKADIKDYFTKVQTSRRLVELYKSSVLPQAEQAVKVSESAYQTDRVDFLNLLDSQRALLDFRLEYYQILAQYGERVAGLERRVGRDLLGPKESLKSEENHHE